MSGFGQYTTLGMVKSKNKEKEIRKTHFNILEKIVTIVQYILLAILGFVVLQILLSSEYSTIILKVGVVIGYTAISSRRHRVANLVRKIKTVLENVLDGKFVPHGTYGINHSKHDLEYGYLIVGLNAAKWKKNSYQKRKDMKKITIKLTDKEYHQYVEKSQSEYRIRIRRKK